MSRDYKEVRPVGKKFKQIKDGEPISYADHTSFEELVAEVQQLIGNQNGAVIVAVSGFGGSGKTTLAEKLKNHFDNSTWVQLDNFIVNRAKGDTWDAGYDWGRLESVLKDVKAGKDLHYQFYDWHKDALTGWIDISPLPKLIIVEGVRILQPRLLPYFDVRVWIDCSLEEATERGKARDRANGADEQHILEWDTNWVPKEKAFYKMFKPDEAADFIVK